MASSTWTRHFIHLSDPPGSEYPEKMIFQAEVKRRWPMPSPSDIEAAWDTLLSMVIVRHPLSRLASIYYEKVIWGSFKIMDKEFLKARAEAAEKKEYEYPGDNPGKPR